MKRSIKKKKSQIPLYKLKYLTRPEAAAYLRISTGTLSKMVEAGQIVAYHLSESSRVSFDRTDLDALIRSNPRIGKKHSNSFSRAEKSEHYAQSGWALFNKPHKTPEDQMKARNWMERALLLNEKNANAHYYWGCMLRDERKISDALIQFEEAIRLKPDFEEVDREIKLITSKREEPKEVEKKEIEGAETQFMPPSMFKNFFAWTKWAFWD